MLAAASDDQGGAAHPDVAHVRLTGDQRGREAGNDRDFRGADTNGDGWSPPPRQRRSSSTGSHGSTKRVMGTGALIAIVFFNVCGGPFGAEGIVSAGGPLVSMVSLLIFPWLWSVPMAALSAELSTAFPRDGGAIVWVTEAFGPLWGFQEGFWNWVSGVLDTALYPHLAADLLLGVVELDAGVVLLLKFAFVVLLTIPNFLGLEVMDSLLSVLALTVLVPFILLVIIGLPRAHPSNWFATKPLGEIDMGELLHLLFWNFNGFTGAGLVAGEVKNPSRTIPRALGCAVALATLTYLLPLGVSVGVNQPPWETWHDGSFTRIAQDIGGLWLSWTVLVVSVVGNIGLFLTDLLLNAYALVGMAERGLVDSRLAWRHPKLGSPWVSLSISFVIVSLLMLMDFSSVLAVTNFLNCAALLLLIGAGIYLRARRPHVPRPVRLPCDGWRFVAVMCSPIVITLGIFVSVIATAGVSLIVTALLVAVGFGSYYLRQWRLTRARTAHKGAPTRRGSGHSGNDLGFALVPDAGVQVEMVDAKAPFRPAGNASEDDRDNRARRSGSRGARTQGADRDAARAGAVDSLMQLPQPDAGAGGQRGTATGSSSGSGGTGSGAQADGGYVGSPLPVEDDGQRP